MLLGEEMGSGTVAGIISAFVAAFAGLAALVGWIVREMFKEQKAQRDAAAAEAEKQREAAAEEAEEARKLYREQLREEREGCDRRAEVVQMAVERAHAEQQGAMHEQARGRAEAMQMLRAVYVKLTAGTQLSAVVTQADDAIWTKTIDGVITSWNRAAHNLLGWHAGEVIGQSVYRIVPPDLHDQERELLERLKRGERVERHETERFHRDGRRVRLEVSISPVRDATGKVVSVGTIAREVP